MISITVFRSNADSMLSMKVEGTWGEKGGSNQREEEEEEDKCCVFCCVESAFKNTTSIYPCIHPPINYRRQGEQRADAWEDTGAHGNGEAGRQVEQEYNAYVCETAERNRDARRKFRKRPPLFLAVLWL